MQKLIAYHGDPANKRAILAQLRSHAKADEIVQGVSWENGKGCAVGCTLHAYDHSLYEPTFGIPQMLARLEDTIFEGLPNADAKEWPVKFMSAIKSGADLQCVGWQFLHWLLTDETVNPGINNPLVCDAIKQCADVLVPLTKGKKVDVAAARSAEWAARATARAAESAESAAEWAAEMAAEWAAARAAESAAWAAESAESAAWAAESAESAAESAAWAAARAAEWAAESAESAARRAMRPPGAWAARHKAYQRMAAKLISLLKAA